MILLFIPYYLFRNNVKNILEKITDQQDWISLIFLILDEEMAPYEGIRLVNEVFKMNYSVSYTLLQYV